MIPAADLAALYVAADGLTVAATFGAETTRVHFRQGDIDIGLADSRIVADYSIRYRAGTLTGLARGSSLVIGAHTYKVLEAPRSTASGDERIARLERSA